MINVDSTTISWTFFHRIGIGYARKSNFIASGYVAIYGGGWIYRNCVYLRLWRVIFGVRLPLKKQPLISLRFFEYFFPKKYKLNKKGEK